ncbi:cell envelope integrity TolA C-terminal domain-containing protein [Providencia manganoxydans]|uniref:cell envelope integrity TolA C-terminal domain-containing protein n=1 Tax=Providencia manganoxydans TaxID=2923283 RepID=UPI0034E46FE2
MKKIFFCVILLFSTSTVANSALDLLDDIADSALTHHVEPTSKQNHQKPPLDAYILKIHSTITHNFHETKKFAGKRCAAKIAMSRQGKIESILKTEGDSDLCKEVISVIEATDFPRPPSDDVWNRIRTFTLDFAV